MTLPVTVSDVVAEHVTFEVECIDRMYLNVYVPGLQYPAGLVGYVHHQLGLPIASTAPLGKITERFVAAVHRFARDQQVPWVDFAKGQRKDDVMHEYQTRFVAAGRTEGVLFVGRAQEKTNLFRTEKRHNAEGRPYPWIVRASGVVNHFYFYCVDADFGPFFLKFCSYFPYNARLCINGNHWAQRQAGKAGLGFVPMDNAFAAVDDPATLQAICDRLGPEQIDALLRKWLAILPHPFSPADRAAGYRYDISILQAEFSLTQMLDRPVTGRIFFEQVIRDNLDVGRPDHVSLIFDRRIVAKGKHPTPGRFRTRVITTGVTPSLHVDYKHTTIKQYHKEGRALRTETTINNTRDFGIGKRLNRPDRCHRTGHHSYRHPRARVTPRSATLPRPAIRAADLPTATRRLHQPRPTGPHRRAARPATRARHHGPDDLRPASPARARPDRTHPPHPPLPPHRDRTAHRDVPHPRPRPLPTYRPGPPQRPRRQQTPPRPDRLPARPRGPRPTSRPPRVTLTPTTRTRLRIPAPPALAL